MEIVEAYWDVVNLGVKSHVVTINHSISCEGISRIKDLNSDYIVVKVSEVKLEDQLLKLGLQYAETSYTCEHNLKIPDLPPIYERLLRRISLRKVNRSELMTVFDKIDLDMFVTDRVARDPVFGPSVARNRYINWMSQVTESNGELLELTLDNEKVGFFCVQCTKDDRMKGILSGVYTKFRGKGLGLFLNYYQILLAKEKGVQLLETAFSSNNPQASNVHESLGFTVSKIEEVYILHK